MLLLETVEHKVILFKRNIVWGHPYTTWSAKGGGGVDEMTMKDHEGGGEGS